MNRLKTEYMKTKIFNLIIIDESGSMHCIKKEAIDSVNETMQTIRAAETENEDQEHFVTLVTFNDNVRTVYEKMPVADVEELNGETYQPRFSTALYDAMGRALSTLRLQVAANDRVLVTIVTDGYENASREYDGKAVKALVDELKAQGWVFAYIGANHDVKQSAATLSIRNAMIFQTTSEGTRQMSECVNRSRSDFFSRLSSQNFDAAAENEHFFDNHEN